MPLFKGLVWLTLYVITSTAVLFLLWLPPQSQFRCSRDSDVTRNPLEALITSCGTGNPRGPVPYVLTNQTRQVNSLNSDWSIPFLPILLVRVPTQRINKKLECSTSFNYSPYVSARCDDFSKCIPFGVSSSNFFFVFDSWQFKRPSSRVRLVSSMVRRLLTIHVCAF